MSRSFCPASAKGNTVVRASFDALIRHFIHHYVKARKRAINEPSYKDNILNQGFRQRAPRAIDASPNLLSLEPTTPLPTHGSPKPITPIAPPDLQSSTLTTTIHQNTPKSPSNTHNKLLTPIHIQHSKTHYLNFTHINPFKHLQLSTRNPILNLVPGRHLQTSAGTN